MTDKPENPPAFPLPSMYLSDGVGYAVNPGMSLRDWLAATMQIPDDAPTATQAISLMGQEPPQWSGSGADIDCLIWWATAEAKYRYMRADAMLEERAK